MPQYKNRYSGRNYFPAQTNAYFSYVKKQVELFRLLVAKDLKHQNISEHQFQIDTELCIVMSQNVHPLCQRVLRNTFPTIYS